MDAFSTFKLKYGKQGKFLEFKNRYMLPPMVCWAAKDGIMNDFHIGRYISFAMGGFGGIMVETTDVESEGRISYGSIGLWSDEQEKMCKRLCDAIHTWFNGTKIGIQIGHAGRKGSHKTALEGFKYVSKRDGGFQLKSCSPIKFSPETDLPKEMSIKEIKEIQKKFIDSCERAKRAGFDWIEIHGAHGYLVNQFLVSSSNKRKDQYGGSFENRIRFLIEIIDGIFERIGEFPVFVRLSCDEGKRKEKPDDKEYNLEIKKANENRWKIDDTLKLVNVLIKKGVCLIDCSTNGCNIDEVRSPIYEGLPCWQIKNPEAIKKKFGDKIAVSAVGVITKAEECKKIIKEEIADFVMLGREALNNPYIPILHAEKMKVSKETLFKMHVKFHGFHLMRRFKKNEKLKELQDKNEEHDSTNPFSLTED